MTRPSEDALIARFFAPLATSAGADGLTDDAAVIPPGEGDLVVTKDMAIAGVHFFPDDPPGLVAAKALRVNLSDLAAKGAVPAGMLLGLGLAADWSVDWLDAFAKGLAADLDAYGCPLLGGDTVKVPGPLTLSVTAFGRANRTVRRRGARPGDLLCVTGTIGDGALGLVARQAERDPATAPGWLAALGEDHRRHLVDRYLKPQPRVALARAVARHASAAMDVSDGLVGDLAKMMAASGTGAMVDAGTVPLSLAAAAAIATDPALRIRALTGGDDYEILLACPPARLSSLQADAGAVAVPLAVIGEVTGSGSVTWSLDGQPLTFGSERFEHF
ncbi:thiamine-phosphate kinase [Phreatobacter oligotrophus]|uniref:Thiamine-monophosphate kinase n=1 Tax=Phreatobacter oligotrophus TaxID=1122261 RepID=A0A2T4ZHV1_9HYPH|nr:thiamine-phosphate kinase [Phreatobacter oligotrophus]PTM61569.1 thiamine-phosphate kinase [Phreatobacter oligotrophus]